MILPYLQLSIPLRCNWGIPADSKVGQIFSFLYHLGAIEALQDLFCSFTFWKLSIPLRCNWGLLQKPMKQIILKLSIPLRCNWGGSVSSLLRLTIYFLYHLGAIEAIVPHIYTVPIKELSIPLRCNWGCCNYFTCEPYKLLSIPLRCNWG